MKRPILWILGLGFLLRIWGVNFGLPELYHADEPIVVNHAVAYGIGDLNPHYFELPPLVSYLVFFTFGAFFLMARGVGWMKGVEDFKELFLSDPTSFYLLARVIFGVILGTACIFLLYRLARKLFSEKHGLLSAWFLATAFLHVRDSHYVYLDMPLLLVLIGSFFPIVRVLEEGRRRDYLLFGILWGVAAATKYNGVFIFVPFFVAHLLRTGLRITSFLDPSVFLSGLVALASYSLLNPFMWVDFKFFLTEFLSMSDGEGLVGLTHHLVYSLQGAIGLPLLIVSLWGLVAGMLKWNGKRVVLASFVLFYYLVLSVISQPYDRYVLPLLPFLAIFSADVLIRTGERRRMKSFVIWAAAFLLAIPSLAKAGYCNVLFSRDDIRKVARQWIEENLVPGEKVALDSPFYMPRPKPTLSQLEEKKNEILSSSEPSQPKLQRVEWMINHAKKQGGARYEIYYLRDEKSNEPFLFAKPNVPYRLNALRDLRIRHVVVARIHKQSQPYFYEELEREAELVKKFTPYKDESRKWAIDERPLTGGPFLWSELVARKRNGQIIEVYRLK